MGCLGAFVDIRAPRGARRVALITGLASAIGRRPVVRHVARGVKAAQIVTLNVSAILDAGHTVAGIALVAVSAHRLPAGTVDMAPGVCSALGGIDQCDIAKRDAFSSLVEAKSGVARACVPGNAAAGINTMRVSLATIGSVGRAFVYVCTAGIRTRGISAAGKTGFTRTGITSVGIRAISVRVANRVRTRTQALVYIRTGYTVAGECESWTAIASVTTARINAIGECRAAV